MEPFSVVGSYTYDNLFFVRIFAIMDAKLTLKMNGKVIEKAKRFASLRKTSLSRLIENYLQNLTTTPQEKESITPLVKSLSGIIDLQSIKDHRKDYTDYLRKKYK